jgi:hypothetical protein
VARLGGEKAGGLDVSTVDLTINGKAVSVDVEDRALLVHLLRENLIAVVGTAHQLADLAFPPKLAIAAQSPSATNSVKN